MTAALPPDIRALVRDAIRDNRTVVIEPDGRVTIGPATPPAPTCAR